MSNDEKREHTLYLKYTQGLPGCGKSTVAKHEQELDPILVTVSKDELRRMMHGGEHSKANEKQVIAIRDAIIEDSLSRKRPVFVHDTNFGKSHHNRFADLAKKYNATLICHDMTNVPLEECIRRDLLRKYSVGEQVIRKMHAQFLAPKFDFSIKNPNKKPLAILCDLDGTLFHANGRSYYGETEKYLDDILNEPLAAMLRAVEESICLILVSGREEEGRKWTEQKLRESDILYQELFMRQTGDSRPDWVVKAEILEQDIQPNYCPILTIDDRLQVLDKTWYPAGIFTLSANMLRVDF